MTPNNCISSADSPLVMTWNYVRLWFWTAHIHFGVYRSGWSPPGCRNRNKSRRNLTPIIIRGCPFATVTHKRRRLPHCRRKRSLQKGTELEANQSCIRGWWEAGGRYGRLVKQSLALICMQKKARYFPIRIQSYEWKPMRYRNRNCLASGANERAASLRAEDSRIRGGIGLWVIAVWGGIAIVCG